MTKLTTRQITFCALFSALIAIGAKLQVTIPLQPVEMHFTLQWLFVMLAGILLRKKLGTLSVAVYLMIGLIGIPVFASGGGPGYLLKPTFGFLLGFVFAAFVIGALVKDNCSYIYLLIVCSIGLIVYYFVGFIYFYFMINVFYQQPIGIIVALIDCFTTIFPDFILCVAASLIGKNLMNVPVFSRP